jgi:hypothetical protein
VRRARTDGTDLRRTIAKYGIDYAGGQGRLPSQSNCKGLTRITVCSHAMDMAASASEGSHHKVLAMALEIHPGIAAKIADRGPICLFVPTIPVNDILNENRRIA